MIFGDRINYIPKNTSPGLDGFFYKYLIDPILSKLHTSIIANLDRDDRVLDIACGTGSLSIAIAASVSKVTGIDLSDRMIGIARKAALEKGKIGRASCRERV